MDKTVGVEFHRAVAPEITCDKIDTTVVVEIPYSQALPQANKVGQPKRLTDINETVAAIVIQADSPQVT